LKARSVNVARINALANIIMLTSDSNKRIANKAPSEYLIEVARIMGDDLASALERNLISMDAYGAALSDDYDAFLELRAEAIHKAALKLTNWPPPA
jgi:hypothetical protein